MTLFSMDSTLALLLMASLLLLSSSCTSYPSSSLLSVVSMGEEKRGFAELRCPGRYDPASFAQLERICEDCYNLYKDAEVHGLCRSRCFSSSIFRRCLQSLLLDADSEVYLEMVEIVGKR